MYEIKIESEEFKEKRTVQQHQMVNQVSGCPSSLSLWPSASECTAEGMVAIAVGSRAQQGSH